MMRAHGTTTNPNLGDLIRLRTSPGILSLDPSDPLAVREAKELQRAGWWKYRAIMIGFLTSVVPIFFVAVTAPHSPVPLIMTMLISFLAHVAMRRVSRAPGLADARVVIYQ